MKLLCRRPHTHCLGYADRANQDLVTQTLEKCFWDKFAGADRFYLKLLDMEARGIKTLDDYQNVAKTIKVRDFRALMGDQRVNQARIKSAAELADYPAKRLETLRSEDAAAARVLRELAKNQRLG